MRVSRLLCALSAFIFVLSIAAAVTQLRPRTSSPSPELPDQQAAAPAEAFLPIEFEPNVGQTDSRVRYLARCGGATLLLTSKEIMLTLCGSGEDGQPGACELLTLSLLGTNAAPKITGLEPLPGVSNYLVGSDPDSWQTEVPHYRRVRYESIYDGIDLEVYSRAGQLEYDFVVAPGVDPAVIGFTFSDAQDLDIDAGGRLVVSSTGSTLLQHPPTIYQEAGGERWAVEGGYLLIDERSVGVRVGAYDASKPLVIDPVLSFSTYLGHGGTDQGWGIAVDEVGHTYVAGGTHSFNFPTVNAYQHDLGYDKDAFVAKLAPGGRALLFSTFFGGISGRETAYDIALDKKANIYLTGNTGSTDFPTNFAVQESLSGPGDAFMTKFDPSGSTIVYSTYLGGSNFDWGKAIAVDRDGYIYIGGETKSSNFPTPSSLFGSLNGTAGVDIDAFVMKLPSSAAFIYWSTYLGGSDDERVGDIACDEDGKAYATGRTLSSDFPTDHALQPTFGSGGFDAWVTQIHTMGWSMGYSTFIGGSEGDEGWDIWVDEGRNAFVVFETWSSDFPTADAFQPESHGLAETAIAQLAPDGSLGFSTFLGGSDTDRGRGIRTDSVGYIYVAGETSSTDFPTLSPFQGSFSGINDVFVTKMTPGAKALVYSTYLGGTGDDTVSGLDVDGRGLVFMTGDTRSSDFPTVGAVQPEFGGGSFFDVFIAALATPLDFFIAATAATRAVAAESNEEDP